MINKLLLGVFIKKLILQHGSLERIPSFYFENDLVQRKQIQEIIFSCIIYMIDKPFQLTTHL